MALTRKFLIDLGIEKDQIQGILDEHGNTVELVKEKAKEDAERQAEKLNGKITALQEKVDNAPEPGGEDWKSKYDAEFAAHGETKKTMQKTYDDYVAGVKSKETTDAKREAIRRHLSDDGANKKLIDLLEMKFDLDKIVLDGDKVKGWDELSKPVKESYADVFTPAGVQGTEKANPPAGGGAPAYTIEQIKSMSEQEINANWDKGVKQALEKGK